MEKKEKDRKVGNEVSQTLRDDLENTGCSNGGDATSNKGNISAYYAIAAVLAVILFVIAIMLFTNLK